MRDKDVRSAVWQKLTEEYAGDASTRLVQEMGIWSGSVRIDIAVINGELCGFELKSDRDTLDRLPLQAEIYSRVFDRITLVVGSRHAMKVCEKIPDWWGVVVAHQSASGIALDDFRETNRNPSPDPFLVAQLLWKDEAISVLESLSLAKGWRSKRIKDIHQRLATALPFEELGRQVRTVLKQRDGWLRQTNSGQFDVSVDANLDPSF
jgi:hypothetical protein